MRPLVATCLFLVCSLWLNGCASSPLERPDVRALADAKPLARVVLLKVECQEPEKSGAAKDWLEDLSRGLRDLNACVLVCTEPDPGRSEKATPPDMMVTVVVQPAEPDDSEIDAAAACLDVLAWSTVPLLPWWIPDVDVHPALRLDVRGELVAAKVAGRTVFKSEVTLPAVRTNLLERYPFLSWPTLGSVVIPPFVFKSGDPVHMNEAAGKRIRFEAAVGVGSLIKRNLLGGELILDMKIVGHREILITPSPDLGKLALRIEGQGGQSTIFELGLNNRGQQRVPLTKVRGIEADGEKLLRVAAYSRRPGVGAVPYSIFIGSDASAGLAPRAGGD
jgi:hypothetical protein